jgi:hypothetical protein
LEKSSFGEFKISRDTLTILGLLLKKFSESEITKSFFITSFKSLKKE